LQVIDRLDL